MYGNDTGLAVVDILQKTCLLNLSIPDMYGSADPYQRTPRSPKQPTKPTSFSEEEILARSKSPIDEQVMPKQIVIFTYFEELN